MRSRIGNFLVAIAMFGLLLPIPAWALITVTMNVPSNGQYISSTGDISMSGNVSITGFDDVDNYSANVGFGTITNGTFNAENDEAPSTFNSSNWANVLPSPPPWQTGMFDHVARITITRDSDNMVVTTAETTAHSVY